MDMLLRKYAEWKGNRKAAQIIIFDGAAEIEKTRAFWKGIGAGAGMAMVAAVLMAPTAVEPALLEQIARREALVHEAQERAEEAKQLTALCLNTAQGMERTLLSYQRLLGR